jgi:hypothetical protein
MTVLVSPLPRLLPRASNALPVPAPFTHTAAAPEDELMYRIHITVQNRGDWKQLNHLDIVVLER